MRSSHRFWLMAKDTSKPSCRLTRNADGGAFMRHWIRRVLAPFLKCWTPFYDRRLCLSITNEAKRVSVNLSQDTEPWLIPIKLCLLNCRFVSWAIFGASCAGVKLMLEGRVLVRSSHCEIAAAWGSWRDWKLVFRTDFIVLLGYSILLLNQSMDCNFSKWWLLPLWWRPRSRNICFAAFIALASKLTETLACPMWFVFSYSVLT